MTEALRIPKTGTVLDPKTMQRIYKPIETYMANAPLIHYSELFNAAISNHQYTVKEKKRQGYFVAKG